MFIAPPDQIFHELRRSGIYFAGRPLHVSNMSLLRSWASIESYCYKHHAPTELKMSLTDITQLLSALVASRPRCVSVVAKTQEKNGRIGLSQKCPVPSAISFNSSYCLVSASRSFSIDVY